ncbi:MAG: hypothetical protein QOF00_5558 [Pseudonocardiales bacterium]|nr:hypothetical protein [Pseudonocardiales bacterium]
MVRMDATRALLLHGVGASRMTWWRATQDLTDLGWEVTAVDMPGHGARPAGSARTMPDLAADVLQQVGDLQVDVVVGHSLGAIVGLAAAALRPDLARAVLLEDPPGLGGAVNPRDVARDVAKRARRARRRPRAETAALLDEHPRWSLVDARNSTEASRAVDTDLVNAALQPDGWDLCRLVADCPVPVHLLAAGGPQSALIDPDRTALLAELADRATVVDSDHCIHRARPGLWLTTVLGVAATVAVPR